RGDHRDGYRHGKRRKAALPRACRVYHHAEHGARYGYSGRCLRKHYAGYRGLPRRCAIVVGGQFGTIYRDKCLSGHGYGTGRR
ncbi:MAG: hypothetical protein RI571_15035, partial [Roseovarius sp.]|nr:hypothetical protein [Roseovarius sp.]